MKHNSRLSQMILRHWQAHRPQVVQDLRNRKQLQQTLNQAEEQTADLLYELVSVQKMPYQEAWEIATREWGFLPTGDRLQSPADLSLSQKKGLPATSG
jgi:hypothetical protein